MSDQPFRFLHASDFHLESPLSGVCETPPHLRELFLDAAYWAAERVFETALAEEVDLVVLVGDLLDVRRTGARGPLFLQQQLNRLRERSVPVYWAGGNIDPPDAWPDGITLPDNVTVFRRGAVEHFVYQRGGEPIAQLLGRSRGSKKKIRPADFVPDPHGPFSIAVAYGAADAAALSPGRVSYWALGGRHSRRTFVTGDRVVHYPGTPQGRSFDEVGPHGCSLVTVDERGRASTALLPCDVLRLHRERIVVDETIARADLERLLRERMQSLIAGSPRTDLLVAWTVSGSGPLLRRLRPSTAADLLEWLRREFGHGTPSAWSVSLQIEPAEVLPPEYYAQETILGDFLREVRRLQSDETVPIDLEAYLSPRYAAGTLGSMAEISDPAQRRHILRHVAALGVDLLAGEELRT